MKPSLFQQSVLNWYDRHGRKSLPWHHQRTPYVVWLSEIMLQQTQVATVIPYFTRFIDRFPTVERLATATLDEVLQLWSGLGYYSRARNLHHAAKEVVELGRFPDTVEEWMALSGIGRSTAGAIMTQAFNQPAAILDGNVKRLLVRFYGIEGWPGERKIEQQLWQLSEALVPNTRCADYTQAMMDLGAMVCRRSKAVCDNCPLQHACEAHRMGLQNTLPHKKPMKKIPTKRTVMVIVQDSREQILLERRPPTGIWGGLWSLPQCEHQDEVATFCQQQLNLTVKPLARLPPFRHTFSHFHLDITPVIVKNGKKSPQVGEAFQRFWYDTDELMQLGLPKPVRTLLQHYMKKAW